MRSGERIECVDESLCSPLIDPRPDLKEVLFTRCDACNIGDLMNADAVMTPDLLKAERSHTMPFLRIGDLTYLLT
jgi:hypothetical protein